MQRKNQKLSIFKNNEKGITLIALVITIVVLIIVAGVAINMTIGENGIITRAKYAKEKEEIASLSEKLELQKANVKLDNNKSLTLANYLEQLKLENIIEDIDIEETGEENSSYIEVEDKYIFSVTDLKNGDVKIEYEGKTGKLIPKIKGIEVIKVTTNSITVKVSAIRVDDGNYKYYIKNITNDEEYALREASNKEEYTLKETSKSDEYTFTGLEQNKEYKIQVEVTNKNGSTLRETEDNIKTTIVQEITLANINFTYTPNEWTNGTITVSVGLKSEITIPEGSKLQTSKDAKDWSDSTSQEFTQNGYIYVRVWDGTNGGSYAVGEVSKIDKSAPTINSLVQGETTTSSIQVSVSAIDNESGIDKYRYSSDGGTTWSEYTTSSNYKIEKLTKGFGCSYSITVEVTDKAGNVSKKNKDMSTINDSDYYVDTKDIVLCNVLGREYIKTYNTPAVMAVAYIGGYCPPLLVSTSASAVEYYTTGHTDSFPAKGTVNYNGTIYYYSSEDWWMQNYYWYKSSFTTLNTISTAISTYTEDAAKMLLNKYFYDTSTKKYEICYEANNGNNAPDRQIYSKGSPVTITSSKPTRNGYHLLGWSTNSNATNADYLPGNAYNIDESITLYAVWQKHDFNDETGICTVCKEDCNYLSASNGGENWNSGQILNFATGFNKEGDCCRNNFNGSWNIHSSCNLCQFFFDMKGGIGSVSDYSNTDGNVCMIIYKNLIDVTNIDKIVFKCQLDENESFVTNKTKIGLCNSDSLSKASDYYNFQESTEVTDNTMSTATYVLQLDVSSYTGNYYLKVTTERLGGTAAGNTAATKIVSMYPIYK